LLGRGAYAATATTVLGDDPTAPKSGSNHGQEKEAREETAAGFYHTAKFWFTEADFTNGFTLERGRKLRYPDVTPQSNLTRSA
jgi:hypothetical protein